MGKKKSELKILRRIENGASILLLIAIIILISWFLCGISGILVELALSILPLYVWVIGLTLTIIISYYLGKWLE